MRSRLHAGPQHAAATRVGDVQVRGEAARADVEVDVAALAPAPEGVGRGQLRWVGLGWGRGQWCLVLRGADAHGPCHREYVYQGASRCSSHARCGAAHVCRVFGGSTMLYKYSALQYNRGRRSPGHVVLVGLLQGAAEAARAVVDEAEALFALLADVGGVTHLTVPQALQGGGGGGKVPACQQAGRGVELPPVTSTAGAPAGSQARQRGSGSVDCRRKPVVTGSACVIPLGWPLCARRLAARPSKAADPRLSPLPLLPWCGCSACAGGPPCGSASQRGPRTSPCRTAGRQGGTRNRFESSVPVQSSTAWRGRLGAWGHRWRRSSMPTESSARNRASSLPAARRPASAPCCSRWCCPGSRSSSHPCRRAARCTGLLAGVGGAERRLREGVRV